MMKLVRVSEIEDTTLGILVVEGIPRFCTLEPPWRGNEPNVSCIPVGAYSCRRRLSPRFGKTYEVTNVPGRSEIIYHSGNVVADTEGCILLGLSSGYLNGKPAVLNSKKAMKMFREYTAERPGFRLIILNRT